MPVSSARDNVLARVRKALGERDAGRVAAAEATIAAHAQGPRPALVGDRVLRFMQRARDMESSIERIAEDAEIPAAVARYLDSLRLSPALAGQKSHAGVCWPEFARLDWAGAGLRIEARPTLGDDRIGVTGAFCAIAETGTVVLLSAADAPTASALLPDTHVAIVPVRRIVDGMEDAFAWIRDERGLLPRAVNLISGPSRTGDIEQTIVLGAHGPFRVHVLVVDR